MRRLMLLVGALTVVAAVVIGPGASGATRDGLLVFHRYGSCPPSGPECYDAIYVARTNGTGVRRLTTSDEGAGDPVWSPDGSRIAYATLDGIFVMNADGSGRRLLYGDGGNRAPAWSPDGRRIAFGQDGVGIVNVDGTHVRVVPGTRRFQVTGLDWSPDGKRLAFEHFFSRIYVVNLDGSGRKLIAQNAYQPRWSPDGKTLLFTRNDGGGIYVVRARGGTPKLISKAPATNAAWSSDGTEIAYASGALNIIHLADRRDRAVRLPRSLCAGGACFDIDWQWLPTR